ncbi:hypothetical protein COMA2_180071 [Candidatus Nitrospira nitrificans]|uniref:Uncharacterized protein n=1 Tax=Candidatus Nitrospira nitrificans TaxID=1742973 RepID=A0A0S4LAG8_9BACT|nr:hypothetical protein COMA2_180071 [Candidatus Nitrospira nitrificans]
MGSFYEGEGIAGELIISGRGTGSRQKAMGRPSYCLTARLSFFSTLLTLLWRRPEEPFR